MDVFDIITSRRSIRKFKEGAEITREQVDKLLTAAMCAPSACNTRPWRFVVVTDRKMLKEIAQTHPYSKMTASACLAIIVCALPEEQSGISEDFFPQDCAAATQNILIQATAMGLGSCWCGVYPKEERMAEMKALLDIGDDMIPFNVIAVGVPDESPGARGGFEESKVIRM